MTTTVRGAFIDAFVPHQSIVESFGGPLPFEVKALEAHEERACSEQVCSPLTLAMCADFWSKETSRGLWLESAPPWVTDRLSELTTLSFKEKASHCTRLQACLTSYSELLSKGQLLHWFDITAGRDPHHSHYCEDLFIGVRAPD